MDSRKCILSCKQISKENNYSLILTPLPPSSLIAHSACMKKHKGGKFGRSEGCIGRQRSEAFFFVLSVQRLAGDRDTIEVEAI